MQNKNKKRYTKVEASEFIDFSFNEEEFQKSLNTSFTGIRSKPIEAYSKDMYILGNFRLILKENVNHYDVEQDPDTLPFWGHVMGVEYLSSTPLSCPICLTSPIAPVITRCGHIYCLSCILHLFSLTGYNGDSCPVCLEETDSESIRPVLFQIMVDHFKPKKRANFSLLHRFKGYTTSVPRDQPPTDHLVHWENYNARYSRFVYAAEISYILEIHLRQLEAAKQEAISSCDPELSYVKDAYNRIFKELTSARKIASKSDKSKQTDNRFYQHTDDLQNNENNLNTNENNTQSELSSSSSWDMAANRSASVSDLNEDTWNFKDLESNLKEEEEEEEEEQYYKYDHHEKHNSIDTENVQRQQNESSKSKNKPEEDNTTKYEYYDRWNLDIHAIRIFYQGYDGSFSFLHPLNLKMLQKQYGHVADFPRQLNVPIIDSESIRITERYRRRNPHMGHVPLGADIALVEVDLRNYISRRVFRMFREQIQQRNARRRKQRQREKEQEREQKQQEEEEIQHRKETMVAASFAPPEFPELDKESLTTEDFPELPSVSSNNSSGSSAHKTSKNSTRSSSKSNLSSTPQRSFSSAVRQGPENDWPSINRSKQKRRKDNKKNNNGGRKKKKSQRGDVIFSI